MSRNVWWYDSGTIPMRMLKWTEGFRRISVKLQQKPMTSCIREYDDSTYIQTCWLPGLHSYASNCRNAQCSWSVPPVTVSTLVSYVTSLSLIIFKIIPHPMNLLTTFPLQVIILYLILYGLFSLAYYRITYLLSSSHIPSPRVRLTCHLNPFS
jgi:hypothetical protein